MRRPPRRCACGLLVNAGSLCICQQRRKAEADKRRPNASQRGYDYAWSQLSRELLSRPENKRCHCGAPAVLMDHIIPIKRAPHLRLAVSNLRPMCHACNSRKAIEFEGGFGRQPKKPGAGREFS